MKKIFTLLTIVAAVMLTFSCQKELPDAVKNIDVNQGGQEKNPEVKPSQELKVSEPGLFGAKGGEYTMTVTATAAWTISKSEGSDWLTIKPESGNAGTAQVTLTAAENSLKELRRATLTIRSGELSKSINVSQSAANPELSLDTNNLEFSSASGSKTFKITTNTSWTVSSDQTWCSVNPASGNGEGSVTTKVEENPSIAERTATITVKSEVGEQIVKVIQSGATPELKLNKNDLSFTAAKGNDTFTITSNTSWTISSDKDWCMVSSTSGSNNATITVNVTENTSTSSRSATITLKAGDILLTIAVTQAGATQKYFWMGNYKPTSDNFPKINGEDVAGIVTTYTSLDDAMAKASRDYSSGEWGVVMYPSSWGTVSDLVFLDSANKNYYRLKKKDLSDFPDYTYYETTLKIGVSTTITLSTETAAKAAGATLYGETTPTPTPDPNPTPSTNYIHTFTVGNVQFKMITVDGGTFTMGATSEQGGDYESDERPTHSVTLSSYSIGETEVTQALWEAVMGSNPSKFIGSNRPVESVSWDDCQTFIRKLNAQTEMNFRLPTEAEWEFAARGGNKSRGYKYSGSNIIGDVAWYSNNNEGGTHNVGSKPSNELGIYDMSGNVWEWCSDWYGNYSSSSQTNPTGPVSGSYRVNRGGSGGSDAEYCRVSSRDNSIPTFYNGLLGFRIAL